MIPIALNLSNLHVVLVGNGEALKRRLAEIQKENPRHLSVFTEDDLPTSPEEQGWQQGYAVVPRLPETHEIRQASVLLVAGLSDETSAVLASIARLQGILVWVEDKPDLCDFYFTSYVKRGDLILSVSTSGASPTLSQEIRTYLGTIFGKEWEGIVTDISKQRLSWKAEGADNKTVSDRTREYIKSHSLLPNPHTLTPELT